jgi:hypothetical protein
MILAQPNGSPPPTGGRVRWGAALDATPKPIPLKKAIKALSPPGRGLGEGNNAADTSDWAARNVVQPLHHQLAQRLLRNQNELFMADDVANQNTLTHRNFLNFAPPKSLKTAVSRHS